MPVLRDVEGKEVRGWESLVGVKKTGPGVERVCSRMEIIGKGQEETDGWNGRG